MAGLERTEILERIWAAKEEKRRRAGMHKAKSSPPFGVRYERKDGRWYFQMIVRCHGSGLIGRANEYR